jgi:pyruvate kinase
VPVIWATQVLESLAKGGMPSRAEVTDAAMASRAECVMLNKGPYIPQTMDFLRDVLARMESHQDKKSSMLRKLSISEARPSVDEPDASPATGVTESPGRPDQA